MPKVQITSNEAEDAIKRLITYFEELALATKKAGESGKISNAEMAKQYQQQADAMNGLLPLLGMYDKKLKDMTKSQRSYITQNKNTKKALAEVTEELKKTEKQLLKVNRAMTKMKAAKKKLSGGIGNIFSGALGGAKQLLAAFGLLRGLQLFADAIKSAFNLTKKLDSLSFSMKAVITSAEELGQTQRWLNKITNDFGADIITTTNRFIKFRAASQQAGLSAKETQKIFGTLTKAAGVLGLRTDELQGIFLALEQMISKGKITTEELRRQLGERLPGAMDIMANSMGVTTAELDKMLKKGEVITKDVLPGFAEQVNIAFGLDKITKVETLQAATVRLKNSWVNLVQEFNQGNDASGKLMRTIDYLSENLGTFLKVVISLIATFIVYKGLMLANLVIKKATIVVNTLLKASYWRLLGIKQLNIIATIQATTAQTIWNSVVVTSTAVTKVLITQLRIMMMLFVTNPIGIAIALYGALILLFKNLRDDTLEQISARTRLNEVEADAIQGTKELAVSTQTLFTRYKELKAMTSLTKDEQKELATVIIEIGENAEDTIVSVNEFGQAIEISGEKVKQFIKDTKEIANIKAKILIEDEGFNLDKTINELEKFEDIAKGGTQEVKGLNQEVRKVTKNGETYYEVLNDTFDIYGKWGNLASKNGKKLEAGWQRMTKGQRLNFLQTEATLKMQVKESQKVLDAAQKVLDFKEQDAIRDGVIAESKAFYDSIIEKVEAKRDKQRASYHTRRMKEIKAEMIAQSTMPSERKKKVLPDGSLGELESEEEANIRKNLVLKKESAEHQRMYNKLMHITTKISAKQIANLKVILSLQREINNLQLNRKILKLEVVANDPDEDVDKRADALREIALLETETAMNVRETILENNQIVLDDKIAKLDLQQAKYGENTDEWIRLENYKTALYAENVEKSIIADEKYATTFWKINQELNNDLDDVWETREDHRLKLIQAGFDEQEVLLNEAYAKEVAMSKLRMMDAQAIYDSSNKTLNDRLKLERVVSEEHELLTKKYEELEIEKAKVTAKAFIAIAEAKIKLLEIDILYAKGNEQLIGQLKAQIAALKKAIKDIDPDEIFNGSEDNYEDSLTKIADWLDRVGESISAVGDIFDAVADRRIEAIEAEMNKTKEFFDEQLRLAGDNVKAKESLELQRDNRLKVLDKKRLKEEQKKAKAKKAFAVSEIIIHTAVAVLRNIVEYGFVPAIPINIATGVLSALQIANVLAQPIPKYSEGLDFAKTDHLGMINDGIKNGRNVKEYVERDGDILTAPSKNAIVPLKKGDTVHKDYESMIRSAVLKNSTMTVIGKNNNDYNKLSNAIEGSIDKGFKKAKINNNININGFDSEREAYKNSLNRWD